MTEREYQVITLAAQGRSQRQIARAVGLSQPGVRKVLLRCGVLVPKGQRDNQPPRSQEQAEQAEQAEHVAPVLAAADSLAAADTLPDAAAERAGDRHTVSLPLGVDKERPVDCAWCQEPFLPRPYRSRFCCNSCGAKAQGMVPQLTHTAECRRCVEEQ